MVLVVDWHSIPEFIVIEFKNKEDVLIFVHVNALFNDRLELIFKPVCEKIVKSLYVNSDYVWFQR